ncbi:MAG: single-stranded DNA-binding protein [Crocinitomicaceae bacterium]|nr:single-stranded DNA-binding protein [Crocinitomicaceae bacterium]
MSGSVNKVILIGNLGKDPEVKRFENGAVIASFSIATSESYVDKQSGEKKEITDWHDVVLWRGLAEVAEKYLHKGTKIYVEGKLKKRSWQDKEGNTRYSTEVVGDEMTILSRQENKENNVAPYRQEEPVKAANSLPDLAPEDGDALPF